jgi:hypothetical protein
VRESALAHLTLYASTSCSVLPPRLSRGKSDGTKLGFYRASLCDYSPSNLLKRSTRREMRRRLAPPLPHARMVEAACTANSTDEPPKAPNQTAAAETLNPRQRRLQINKSRAKTQQQQSQSCAKKHPKGSQEAEAFPNPRKRSITKHNKKCHPSDQSPQAHPRVKIGPAGPVAAEVTRQLSGVAPSVLGYLALRWAGVGWRGPAELEVSVPIGLRDAAVQDEGPNEQLFDALYHATCDWYGDWVCGSAGGWGLGLRAYEGVRVCGYWGLGLKSTVLV